MITTVWSPLSSGDASKDSSLPRISASIADWRERIPINYSIPRYFAIFFNPETNKALEDAQVRAALAYATDKNEILTNRLGRQRRNR